MCRQAPRNCPLEGGRSIHFRPTAQRSPGSVRGADCVVRGSRSVLSCRRYHFVNHGLAFSVICEAKHKHKLNFFAGTCRSSDGWRGPHRSRSVKVGRQLMQHCRRVYLVRGATPEYAHACPQTPRHQPTRRRAHTHSDRLRSCLALMQTARLPWTWLPWGKSTHWSFSWGDQGKIMSYCYVPDTPCVDPCVGSAVPANPDIR